MSLSKKTKENKNIKLAFITIANAKYINFFTFSDVKNFIINKDKIPIKLILFKLSKKGVKRKDAAIKNFRFFPLFNFSSAINIDHIKQKIFNIKNIVLEISFLLINLGRSLILGNKF